MAGTPEMPEINQGRRVRDIGRQIENKIRATFKRRGFRLGVQSDDRAQDSDEKQRGSSRKNDQRG